MSSLATRFLQWPPALAVSFALLTSNAAAQNEPIPDQPQVTILGASRSSVASAVTDEMLQQKFTLVRSTDYEMIFEKKGGLLESLLAGSRYDAQPVYRVAFNFISGEKEIRILGTQSLVTNPGSGFERQNVLDAKKHRKGMQALLESIRAKAGHGSTSTYAVAPAAAPAAAPAPNTSVAPVTGAGHVDADSEVGEHALLKRDLADIRRLKRLAAPGGSDADYYARREQELESRIAGIELGDSGRARTPQPEVSASHLPPGPPDAPATASHARTDTAATEPATSAHNSPRWAPRTNAQLLTDTQLKLAIQDSERLGLIEGFEESGQDTLTLQLTDSAINHRATERMLSGLYSAYRVTTSYSPTTTVLLRHRASVVGEYTTRGFAKLAWE
jgi:hypothetical protein